MAPTPTLAGTSEAAIFARLWDPPEVGMTPDLARQILRLTFADTDKARMHELAVKNQEDVLSDEERDEFDNYIRVGDLLAILQSKARLLLGRPLGGLNGDG